MYLQIKMIGQEQNKQKQGNGESESEKQNQELNKYSVVL